MSGLLLLLAHLDSQNQLNFSLRFVNHQIFCLLQTLTSFDLIPYLNDHLPLHIHFFVITLILSNHLCQCQLTASPSTFIPLNTFAKRSSDQAWVLGFQTDFSWYHWHSSCFPLMTPLSLIGCFLLSEFAQLAITKQSVARTCSYSLLLQLLLRNMSPGFWLDLWVFGMVGDAATALLSWDRYHGTAGVHPSACHLLFRSSFHSCEGFECGAKIDLWDRWNDLHLFVMGDWLHRIFVAVYDGS